MAFSAISDKPRIKYVAFRDLPITMFPSNKTPNRRTCSACEKSHLARTFYKEDDLCNQSYVG